MIARLPAIVMGLFLLIPSIRAIAQAQAEPIAPALELWAIRPDQQWQRLIDLFEGTAVGHPAGALAAWKRSGTAGEPRSLGKAVEAAIASVNPQMVPELRTLHGARFCLAFDGQGELQWWARSPEDDGTIAALATALVLTDGQREPMLGRIAVDRLGPPGAPVLAEVGETVWLADSRNTLERALQQNDPEPDLLPRLDSGWQLRSDPERLQTASALPARRLAEALLGLGCQRVEALVGLEGETLSLSLSGHYEGPPALVPRLDPAWLEWLPADRLVAALALPIDPSREAWDRLFTLFDRVERADPDRKDVAPIRVRLNLLALALGIQPDRDVWPRVIGLSACATVDPEGNLDGVLIALHARNEADAEQLETRVVTPLIRWSARPFQLSRQGATVLVAWGETILDESVRVQSQPEQSVSALVPDLVRGAPHRIGLFWPGRVPGWIPEGSPWNAALADAPPILWQGWNEGPTTRDAIQWPGWRGTIARVLDQLALEPSP